MITRDFKGVWIPKEIYLNKELNWTDKILLLEIDSLDNEDGCFASNAYFSEFLGISQINVSKSISKLKKLGYIRQESFDGRTRILRSCLSYGKSDLSQTISLPYQTRQGSLIENDKYNNIYNNTCIKEKDISISNDIDISKKKEKKITLSKNKTVGNKFIQPTVREVVLYCQEANIDIDANLFVDFYESKGWRVGSATMKDWKAAVRNWARRDNHLASQKQTKNNKVSYEYGSFDLSDLEAKVQNGFMSRELAESLKEKYKQKE